MKTMSERIKLRLRKDRPWSATTVMLPDDVVEDLKEVAPALGYGNHHALIRSYIGQGLRQDLERLDEAPVQRLAESLRKEGLSDETIAHILVDSQLSLRDRIPQQITSEVA